MGLWRQSTFNQEILKDTWGREINSILKTICLMIAGNINCIETGNATIVKNYLQGNKQRDAILRHKLIPMSQFRAIFLTFITRQSTMHRNLSMITILKVWNWGKTSKIFSISITLTMIRFNQNIRIKTTGLWKKVKPQVFSSPKDRETLQDCRSSESKEIIKWESLYCRNTISPNITNTVPLTIRKILKVHQNSYLLLP